MPKVYRTLLNAVDEFPFLFAIFPNGYFPFVLLKYICYQAQFGVRGIL